MTPPAATSPWRPRLRPQPLEPVMERGEEGGGNFLGNGGAELGCGCGTLGLCEGAMRELPVYTPEADEERWHIKASARGRLHEKPAQRVVSLCTWGNCNITVKCVRPFIFTRFGQM
jgi:hypothetical protein